MSLVHETDFGTAASRSDATVSLTIDGREVTVPSGASVMRAAMEAGIGVPKLCATDMLDAFGSCRLCVVEVEGMRGTPASCTTLAADGMKVSTQTDRLKRIRKGVMEFYVSDHPLDCLTCAANGDCELQTQAGAVGLREVRYGEGGDTHLGKPMDVSNPCFQFDPPKCVVCSRCVRACEEVQGTFALTIAGRGIDSRAGSTSLRGKITDRVAPGVVYTTFHHPATQVNVITTDFSDWATNCPEYKVSAVQVSPSNGPTDWQESYDALSDESRRIVRHLGAAE